MADALGILAKAAFRKDRGLYGAGPSIEYPDTPGATDLGSGHQVPFSSESLKKALDRDSEQALVGSGGATADAVIAEDSAGGISGPLRWRGWERLIMCALGFEHPDDSPATLAVGAYAHLFEIDEQLQDQAWSTAERGTYTPPSASDRKVRRGMLGLAKQVSDWVWQSVYVTKITFTGNPKDVKVALDFIAYDYVKGSYNSGSWTLPSGSTAKCLFQQCVVKLGTRAGGAAGLLEVEPSSFEIVVDNKLGGDDRTTASGVNIVQPVRSDKVDVTMKLEFPRYYGQLELFTDWGEANTELAAELEITGPEIGSTGYNRLWGFYMSSVRRKDGPANIDGPGPITTTMNLEAHKPGGSDIFAATKYHSITTVKDSPLVVVCQNEDSGNYLLET